MKKSHTVLSVTTRNIPGREIPDPHPIVIPSKMATCINAHKIIIKVLKKLWKLRNTCKIHHIEKTNIVTHYCDNIHNVTVDDNIHIHNEYMRKLTTLIILLVALNSTQIGVFNASSYFNLQELF